MKGLQHDRLLADWEKVTERLRVVTATQLKFKVPADQYP
jgi:hypothetical protein